MQIDLFKNQRPTGQTENGGAARTPVNDPHGEIDPVRTGWY